MARTFNNEIILAAIEGFEAQKARIDGQIAELREMLTGKAVATPAAVTRRKRRRISAAGRARIAEAQRKRWAATKGQSAVSKPKPTRPKRRLSPAGRAAIVAALKKRWAEKRAGAAPKAKPAKKTARKKASTKRPVVLPATAA